MNVRFPPFAVLSEMCVLSFSLDCSSVSLQFLAVCVPVVVFAGGYPNTAAVAVWRGGGVSRPAEGVPPLTVRRSQDEDI